MVTLLLAFTLAFAAEKPKKADQSIAPPKQCYSEKDVKDEGCRVLCIRDGYTGGKTYKKGCACLDVKENLDDFVTRRVTLGTKMHTFTSDEPRVEVHVDPWYIPSTGTSEE